MEEVETISIGYSIVIVLLSALATWLLLYILEAVFDEDKEESEDEIRRSSKSSKHSKEE